jgi:hypothetical protein
MIFYQLLDNTIGVTNAAGNKIFKTPVFWVLANPYYRVEVLLLILLPILSYRLIPLLQNPNEICELLIFSPPVYNLNRIQRL